MRYKEPQTLYDQAEETRRLSIEDMAKEIYTRAMSKVITLDLADFHKETIMDCAWQAAEYWYDTEGEDDGNRDH